MPKFEILSPAEVRQYEAWQVLDRTRKRLAASIPSGDNLLPDSVIVQARTKDGTLVRVGEDKGEVLRHDTPYGSLILDRARNIVQSPLRPCDSIRFPRSLGRILAKLLENPNALVSQTELHQARFPQDTTCTPGDRENIRININRLRSLLGDRFNPPTQTWQLIFTFKTGEQTYYSLTPYLPNNRREKQGVDMQRYIYRHEIPSVGELVLYADRGIVQSPLKPGQNIVLTTLETRLLAVLMSDPERVFPRQVLVQETWNDPSSTFSQDSPEKLRLLIYRLRSKLRGDYPSNLIHTFKRFGYSLTGPKEQTD